MEAPVVDTFWDGLPALIGRDPEMVHGAPVMKNEKGQLTRLPVSALVENVEAFMEMEGMTKDQAIEATLDCFPGVNGGKNTLRKLLDYQEAHLNNMQPS
jgi:hypothetical protein